MNAFCLPVFPLFSSSVVVVGGAKVPLGLTDGCESGLPSSSRCIVGVCGV